MRNTGLSTFPASASAYDQRQKRLQDVTHPTVYQTLFASPQMELFELDDEQWLKIRMDFCRVRG